MISAWLTVLLLIIIGLIIIMVEILFVPGITIVGLLGFMTQVFGYIAAYHYFGNTIGHCVLAGGIFFSLGTVWASFKAGLWSVFALKQTIKGQLNQDVFSKLKTGDEGITTSVLRPSGKAEFGDITIEVHSQGDYIERGKSVKIMRIEFNKVFVQLI